jgi:hypothetical protein
MNLDAKTIKEIYKEELDKMSPKHAEFFLEFLATGNISGSYKKAYSRTNSLQSAALLGRRILNKIGFKMSDYLEYMGHNDDKLSEALNKLYIKDPDKYIEKIIRLRKLDATAEISVNIPTINIITSRNEDVSL